MTTPWETLAPWSELRCPVGGWKPDAIARCVAESLSDSDAPFERTRLGESFEGRPIEQLTFGGGPRRVLMWSQMHGDEPTHTTVLLNLLRLLARSGPVASTLLEGLTMGVIVPLNPDGAERNTRHNGQGIDVNRDALAFATPEGRALRNAVRDFRPAYGFNLHNQHHRTAIGVPPQPAAVSLLVPPVDASDSVTEATAEASRVAAFFCERAHARCEGRISRYDADFMPRAFGEWVQRQGAATILVEAGGWPGGDFFFLETLHFVCFVQTLEAIATDALGAARTASYFDLRRSSPNHLFDLVVRCEGIAQHPDGRITHGELGVDYPHRKAGWYEFRDGVVRAIGDLHENGGLDLVEGGAAVVAPGRVLLADSADGALREPDARVWSAAAARGATTLLVPVDLAGERLAERLAELTATPPPLHAALVGYWGGAKPASGPCEPIAAAVAAGVVALLDEQPCPTTRAMCERLGVALLDSSSTPRLSLPNPDSLGSWVAETTTIAERLGWGERGRIALGVAADFVLIDPAGLATCSRGALGDCLHGVYVGGTVVADAAVQGAKSPDSVSPGRWLLRRR